jgi:hypothetical protein
MPLPNLDKIPEEFKTAREIGLAAASLGALARRGLVEVLDTTPKQYRRISDRPHVYINYAKKINQTMILILVCIKKIKRLECYVPL